MRRRREDELRDDIKSVFGGVLLFLFKQLIGKLIDMLKAKWISDLDEPAETENPA